MALFFIDVNNEMQFELKSRITFENCESLNDIEGNQLKQYKWFLIQ